MRKAARRLTSIGERLCLAHGFESWQSRYIALPLFVVADLLDPVTEQAKSLGIIGRARYLRREYVDAGDSPIASSDVPVLLGELRRLASDHDSTMPTATDTKGNNR